MFGSLAKEHGGGCHWKTMFYFLIDRPFETRSYPCLQQYEVLWTLLGIVQIGHFIWEERSRPTKIVGCKHKTLVDHMVEANVEDAHHG